MKINHRNDLGANGQVVLWLVSLFLLHFRIHLIQGISTTFLILYEIMKIPTHVKAFIWILNINAQSLCVCGGRTPCREGQIIKSSHFVRIKKIIISSRFSINTSESVVLVIVTVLPRLIAIHYPDARALHDPERPILLN